MSLFLFLTVVQALVAAALVGVILMQRSEGGGLGVGGSPNGMMSARGAADFLSRSTKWLAIAFVGLSIALAALAVKTGSAGEVTSTINRDVKADVKEQKVDPLAEVGIVAPNAQAPAAGATAAPGEAAPAADPLAIPAKK